MDWNHSRRSPVEQHLQADHAERKGGQSEKIEGLLPLRPLLAKPERHR
jgi:hypothetical protein